jgi:hypothetical protein
LPDRVAARKRIAVVELEVQCHWGKLPGKPPIFSKPQVLLCNIPLPPRFATLSLPESASAISDLLIWIGSESGDRLCQLPDSDHIQMADHRFRFRCTECRKAEWKGYRLGAAALTTVTGVKESLSSQQSP